MTQRRNRRGTMSTHNPDRFTRSEPFEVFTRPQRSVPARLLGLAVRRRAEITIVVAVAAWVLLTDRMPTWTAWVLFGVLLARGARVTARRSITALVVIGQTPSTTSVAPTAGSSSRTSRGSSGATSRSARKLVGIGRCEPL